MNILVDGQTLESAERNRGIGVYFKNILNSMVKGSYEHTWYIAVSDSASLQYLDPWVASRVQPVVNGLFRPGFDYGRTGEYTAALAGVVEEYGVDVYWNPNPLMVNVLFPNGPIGCPVYFTVHDLIPAVMPIKEWGDAVREEYHRRFETMKNLPGAHAICISRATEQDFKKFVGNEVATTVILEAANELLFYTRRTAGGVSGQPTLLFTGGFDYRKNINGAVEAFARALEKYPENPYLRRAKFYLVCNCEPAQKWAFYDSLQQKGLLGRVELTGFIPDGELSALYARADVFFFPSLYEGFGLPLLEAMLGGAYVLSADNSSLPEVVGPHGLLCDAGSIEDMADSLNTAFLAAAKETAADKQARQAYALSYSWQKAAGEALEYFSRAGMASEESGQMKIAIVTPWPKQKTGIASYVYQLMPYLTRYFSVDVFVDTSGDDAALVENPWGGLHTLEQLAAKRGEYDQILYQFGNSAAHHTGIYHAAKQYGGVGEVHDFILHHFFLHTFFLNGDSQSYREALELAYGEEGLAHYKEVEARGGAPDDARFPMSEIVGKLCGATIFHNNFSRRQVREKHNVFVIPLAAFPPDEAAEETLAGRKGRLREKFGLREGAFLLGAMGFINKNKRPEQLLEAVKALKAEGRDIQLVFLGQADYEALPALVAEKGLKDDVVATGYLEKEEYEAGLSLCDAIANLRYPSMGESSATLCEAFRYAKPVLVSEVNQYLEFPDEVCWKVPVGEYEVPVLTAMLRRLMEDEPLRIAMGQNALAYADTVLAPPRIARLYNQVMRGLKNP